MARSVLYKSMVSEEDYKQWSEIIDTVSESVAKEIYREHTCRGIYQGREKDECLLLTEERLKTHISQTRLIRLLKEGISLQKYVELLTEKRDESIRDILHVIRNSRSQAEFS